MKRKQLEQLAAEVQSAIPDHWFFPTLGNVQGFLGTGPVMAVGERPSTGKAGGPADRLLYRVLEECGAADAHLTDVIKSRGKVGEPYPEDMSAHRRVFDREIEIVRPDRIIAFGQKVYDLLQFTLAGSGIRIGRVWHYSYTRRGQDKVAGFRDQMRRALGA